MKYIKRGVAVFLSVCMLAMMFVMPVKVSADPASDETKSAPFSLPCRSAILMDAATGTVLFEQNADEVLPPASVTKIMTLLLVMEAVESGKIALSDPVTVSAHAASMGGSQVYLKEGETMTVEEMIKCVVIASANDCAVALAEAVAGSEEGFVKRMNERAQTLGMVNTNFENTNGLDDTAVKHVTSARDIALMSRALMQYPKIFEYSKIWMDSIRDGAFGLTNTNRLVRFYPGCTGLKTGSTAKAKFCISATAERDGLSLICVIMAADTRDIRNAAASKLLDYGFANYSLYTCDGADQTVKVTGGTENSCAVQRQKFAAVVPKGGAERVQVSVQLPQSLPAPLCAGDQAGKVSFILDGQEIGSIPITVQNDIPKMDFGTLFCRLLSQFVLM